MKAFAVDTNVAIVANGKTTVDCKRHSTSFDCKGKAIRFLNSLLNCGMILLDNAGEIQIEYSRHLNPSGQPGVGDRFYVEVIRSHPKKIKRVELKVDADGEYKVLPQILRCSNFDRSDRKFVAAAIVGRGMIANAVDSDWMNHAEMLKACGVSVRQICFDT